MGMFIPFMGNILSSARLPLSKRVLTHGCTAIMSRPWSGIPGTHWGSICGGAWKPVGSPIDWDMLATWMVKSISSTEGLPAPSMKSALQKTCTGGWGVSGVPARCVPSSHCSQEGSDPGGDENVTLMLCEGAMGSQILGSHS